MNINYNVTGKERKALAKTIAEVIGLNEEDIKYLGAPSFNYLIGGSITVTKDGIVILPELDDDIIKQLMADLEALGYKTTDAPEHEETENVNAEHDEDTNAKEPSNSQDEEATESGSDDKEDSEAEDPYAPTRITVSIKNDLTGDEEERLFAIVESKHTLLKKALGTDDLPIEVDKDVIRFPWFTDHAIDGEAEAYLQLISAIVKMAKEQKRVTAKDKQEENEKFAMRIFLVRLGLKGPDYKLVRKLMSRNLSGNSSWKNGKPEKADETKGDVDGATTENHKEVE